MRYVSYMACQCQECVGVCCCAMKDKNITYCEMKSEVYKNIANDPDVSVDDLKKHYACFCCIKNTRDLG